MSDHAYDISYLLETEMTPVSVPAARPQRTAPAPAQPSPVAAAQDALAQELMQAAAVHDALVQQYLRTSSY